MTRRREEGEARVDFGAVYRVSTIRDRRPLDPMELRWKQIAVFAVHNIGELALAVRELAKSGGPRA
jgi:hypothetical protein